MALPALAAFADDADTSIAVPTDNDLKFRVSSALHSDPYLYARHINVAVKDGSVVLTGFVANDWELDKAVRVATEAAKPHKVIDSIEIQEGGKR
jgi:hyperosmotically inducible protein